MKILLLLAILTFHGTAPTTRYSCEMEVRLPASQPIEFVQCVWVCWNCTPFFPTFGYQQFRLAPGAKFMVYRDFPPGLYTVSTHVIDDRGWHQCLPDTSIKVLVQ